MYPGPSNKTLAQLREANFAAPLVIQEIMQTKPGRQDDYIRELDGSTSHGRNVPANAGWARSPRPSAITRSSTTGHWTAAGNLSPTRPVVEGKPARRDRHLDERGARAARRLGRLDLAGPTAVAPAVIVSEEQWTSPTIFSTRQVMANPLPYYRICATSIPVLHAAVGHLRPVPFQDIWEVLEVNDGMFVASEGTLPPAAVLARTTPDRSRIRRCIRCHLTRCSSGSVRRDPPVAFRAVATQSQSPNSRTGSAGWPTSALTLLPRGSFDLTQEYGGIVVASVVCELLGIPDDLAPQVLAAVNAGSRRTGRRRRDRRSPAQLFRISGAGSRAPPRRPVRG